MATTLLASAAAGNALLFGRGGHEGQGVDVCEAGSRHNAQALVRRECLGAHGMDVLDTPRSQCPILSSAAIQRISAHRPESYDLSRLIG